MPFFERDGARLSYEVHGEGSAVLMIAPGGMRSSIAAWKRLPVDLVGAVAARHRAVVMDQRNAGASTAPVRAGDGWATYTDDQLALMDHLGIERFAVAGMCIGGPYAIRLCRAAPERVGRAVLFQPIGREGDNRAAFHALFDGWADELRAAHPEASDADWASFRAQMWDGDDLLYGASEDDVRATEQPLLVLRGDDLYHPAAVSRRVVELAPRAELVEEWRDPARGAEVAAKLLSFLAAPS
ncbi:MAG: alpha/beta hydrolase [Myxococcota bacterium]